MNFFKLALCFVAIGVAYADDSIFQHQAPLPAMQFLSSGMPNQAPSLYVWDEQAEPAYFLELEGIKKGLSENNKALEASLTSQQLQGFAFLEDYLAQYDIWHQGKKVMLLHVIDPRVGACPPCGEAEEILATYLKSSPNDYVLVKTIMTN